MGPGRQRGQLQPGRPPLGARLERGHERGVQLQPHHLVEEHLRLVGGEPEVRGPHLHELATRAQTGQRERRVGPGGHRQRDLRRQVVQQEGHRLVDGGPVDDVVVVERHHRGAGEHVEIVDQADQDGVGRRGRRRPRAGRARRRQPRARRSGSRPRGGSGTAAGRRRPGRAPARPPCVASARPPATAPAAWSCRSRPAPRRGPAAALAPSARSRSVRRARCTSRRRGAGRCSLVPSTGIRSAWVSSARTAASAPSLTAGQVMSNSASAAPTRGCSPGVAGPRCHRPRAHIRAEGGDLAQAWRVGGSRRRDGDLQAPLRPLSRRRRHATRDSAR